MQNQSQAAVSVSLQNSEVLLARESDFRDFVVEAPEKDLFALKQRIKNALKQLGEVRSPVSDMLRMRLHELRHVTHAL